MLKSTATPSELLDLGNHAFYGSYARKHYELRDCSRRNPMELNSTLSFRGSLLWNALSDEVKLATSINDFKKEIQ